MDDEERMMFRGDTTDMLLSLVGIRLEKQRRTRDVLERVEANRRAVRDFRRRYAFAVRTFDIDRMAQLEAGYAQAFPDMVAQSGPLGVSHHDVRRYNDQARLTSVQRMLGSLGKRFSYLEADIYEHEPDLIAQPTGIGGF